MGDTLEKERSVPMENLAGVKKKRKRKESRYGKRYGLEFKLRCVKLRLEEGLPISLLSEASFATLVKYAPTTMATSKAITSPTNTTFWRSADFLRICRGSRFILIIFSYCPRPS